MKSRSRRSKRLRVIHLWTLPEVEKALPYLRSVVSSLREHWLELTSIERRLHLAEKKTFAMRRDRLIAMQDLKENRDRAQDRFDTTLRELNDIDVFLLDAVQGIALVPFRLGDDLAWFVFDRFNDEGLVGWRFHQDPFEMRRPLDVLPLEVSAAVV